MNLTEKYIKALEEKELTYKDCQECDSGMILLKEAILVLKQFEAELINQFLQTDINYGEKEQSL